MKEKNQFIDRQIARVRLPIEVGRFVIAVTRHAITGRHLDHMEDSPPASYGPPTVVELEFPEPLTVDPSDYTTKSGDDRRDLRQRLVDDWGYPPEQVDKFARKPKATEQIQKRITKPYG